MKTFDQKIKDYAKLAIKIGVNIQEGQKLIISAPIESYLFVRELVKEAYKAGSSLVIVEYNDEQNILSRYEYGDKFLETISQPYIDAMTKEYSDGCARLSVIGHNPTLLKNVDTDKIKKLSRARSKAMKPFYDLITDSHSQWSIVAYPTKEWASEVFPDLSQEDAFNKLFDEILKASRINENDPIENWNEHNKNIHEKSKWMNDQQFDSLRYTSPGTDIVIGLADGHIWEGGSGLSRNNVMHNANIPTEEIFTTPHSHNVNGQISSTKPLYYRGNKIDGIVATFKDGKIIDIKSSDGEKILKDMISEDEGASRLGEVALVPHDSPISNSKIIFQETLFDENASCHLAFGQSYSTCMTTIENESKEDYVKRGGNFSTVHTDWMVGSSELNIFGIKNGVETQIFSNGNWCI